MRSAWLLALVLLLAVAGSAHGRKSIAEIAKEDRVRLPPMPTQDAGTFSNHRQIFKARCGPAVQSLFAIETPFGFGKDGHVEIGLSEFQVWHQAGQGVPDPNIKRMGFFITTAEAQTLVEFDLSQVNAP